MFIQLCEKQKKIREDARKKAKPKLRIRKDLAEGLAKFTSKVATKDKTIKTIVNQEENQIRKKRKTKEEQTNTINELHTSKLIVELLLIQIEFLRLSLF